MNSNQKRLSAWTILILILTAIVVPWRVTMETRRFEMWQVQYGFIWSPPRPFGPRALVDGMSHHSDIMISFLVLEWVIIAVFYFIFLKAFKDLAQQNQSL